MSDSFEQQNERRYWYLVEKRGGFALIVCLTEPEMVAEAEACDDGTDRIWRLGVAFPETRKRRALSIYERVPSAFLEGSVCAWTREQGHLHLDPLGRRGGGKQKWERTPEPVA